MYVWRALIYCTNYFTGGVDYTSGPYNVSFRRDQQESYFYLSITDDVTYEGDECFYISFGSLPHGVVSGDRSTAKVIIQDDECKSINYK